MEDRISLSVILCACGNFIMHAVQGAVHAHLKFPKVASLQGQKMSSLVQTYLRSDFVSLKDVIFGPIDPSVPTPGHKSTKFNSLYRHFSPFTRPLPNTVATFLPSDGIDEDITAEGLPKLEREPFLWEPILCASHDSIQVVLATAIISQLANAFSVLFPSIEIFPEFQIHHPRRYPTRLLEPTSMRTGKMIVHQPMVDSIPDITLYARRTPPPTHLPTNVTNTSKKRFFSLRSKGVGKYKWMSGGKG